MFFGMGTNPRVYFLDGMGRRSLVVFQGRKVGLKKNSKELFFWWCGMGWLEKGVSFIFILFFWVFCDMVT
jgi:hypothetical protein